MKPDPKSDLPPCETQRARWPGMFFCMELCRVECEHRRYFNDVAYCIHPKREAMAVKTESKRKR